MVYRSPLKIQVPVIYWIAPKNLIRGSIDEG